MHRQDRSKSRSRISYSSQRGTQTDLTHSPGYFSDEHVTLPSGLFSAMARSYYSRHSQTTSVATMTGHATNLADAQCQTDLKLIIGAKVNRSTVQPNVIELDIDEDQSSQTTAIEKTKEPFDEQHRDAVVSTSSTEKATVLSTEPSASNKTSYGKQHCCDYSFVIERLTPEEIRSFDCSSGQLAKITMKAYMERKLPAGEKQPNKSTLKKRSVPSCDVKEAAKASSAIEDCSEKSNPVVSQKSTSESTKRKDNGEQEGEKTKQAKTSRSCGVYQSLAQSIEALADADDEIESIPGHDDLQQWCLDKVIHLVEKYKNKSLDKSSKNRH